jgi:putative phosphoribosyl transferase
MGAPRTQNFPFNGRAALGPGIFIASKIDMAAIFSDRRHAGRALAEALQKHPALEKAETVVLALPRGGVPVGYEVAKRLNAPLAVFIVRKLGVPGNRELAMGAIASGGVRVVNEDVVRALGIPRGAIDQVAAEEMAEVRRREQMFGGAESLPPIKDRTVVLVDDGLATGSTMRAAVHAVRRLEPRQIIVAVPVASADTCEQLSLDADHVVCLYTPEPFRAVGLWYRDFDQTSDDEVRALVAASRMEPADR